MNSPTTTEEKILSSQKRILWILCALTLAVAALVVTLALERRPESSDLGHSTIFQSVIFDAAQENEVADVARLFPINEFNASLIWQEFDGEKWLSVVAWMKNSDYQNYYQPLQQSGETGAIPKGVSLWVTAHPQVKHFCQNLDLPYKPFRIKQYLGLDPNRRYDTFVKLWVKAEDLFRPCPDPEIDDDTCDTTFDPHNPPTVKNMPDYEAFFNQLMQTSYATTGAPWTRLGYTGTINDILLDRPNRYDKRLARKTYDGLINEMKAQNEKIRGPLYRMIEMKPSNVLKTFIKDQSYISPCFEAFSKSRLAPGRGVPASCNTRLIIVDDWVTGADLEQYNSQQREVLIPPGTRFFVTAVRTLRGNDEIDNDRPGIKEVGLKFEGNRSADFARAERIKIAKLGKSA